jgi:hypothetical protein
MLLISKIVMIWLKLFTIIDFLFLVMSSVYI